MLAHDTVLSTAAPLLAQTALQGRFSWIDWLVILGYLALTTWIGTALAGKQATFREFFLGGRTLPWWAVCGSTIATEISAVTFIGVPALVYGLGPESNFKYLQLGLIGWILSRVIVGYVFIPAYYKREIYSPYDYMANQIGAPARTVTTCLFVLGGALAQGSRVYLTALILDMIVGPAAFGRLAAATNTDTLVWSIYVIGLIAVVWTWIGGITTVIWTDLMLFFVFMASALFALGAVIWMLPGGFANGLRELFAAGWSAKQSGPWGKFTFFDTSPSPIRQYTVWTALIACTWNGLNNYGTDQLMIQRIFCCRSQREARRATIVSGAAALVTATMLLVGVGLYAFYQHYPLSGEAAALVAAKQDRIFPVFIMQQLPTGVIGIVIAGIFAAAISTLVSVLAAFSQTTISAFYLPYLRRRYPHKELRVSAPAEKEPPASAHVEKEPRASARAVLGTKSTSDLAKPPPHDPQASACADSETQRKPTHGSENPDERHLVRVSRVLVIVWGIVLCIMAQLAEAATAKFPAILDLALSMAGYTGGALLAGFMLAFLRLGIDYRGFLWSAPLSVLTVFAVVWHQPWSHVVCWAGAAVLLLTWLRHLYTGEKPLFTAPDTSTAPSQPRPILPPAVQSLLLLVGIGLMLWINHDGYFGTRTDAQGRTIYQTVAWPWFTPIGSTVAFTWGYLLARHSGLK